MNTKHESTSGNLEVKYGTQVINNESCKIISYVEPSTGDQIVLIEPPRRETSAYRNGILTGITMQMVRVRMQVYGY